MHKSIDRKHNIVKILYWDHNGFCLWHKRLEKDSFQLPDSKEQVLSIGSQELAWLMDGLSIHQKKAHNLKVTRSLLAHILTAKFADALSFYRQEKQFARIGVELPRSTMCSWAMRVAQACEILLGFMQAQILQGLIINIDETTAQVLKEPKQSKCYMWVFKGGAPGKPIIIILFQYHPTRSGDVTSDFLNGYQGIVQTDGYAVTALKYISEKNLKPG